MLLLLVAGVAGLHACVTDQLAASLNRFNSTPPMPERIEVTYVREMQPSPPPRPATPAPVVAVVAPAPPPAAPVAAAAAASAPDTAAAPLPTESPSAPENASLAEVDDAPPAESSVEDTGAFPLEDGPDMAADASDTDAPPTPPVDFAWPGATRLSYVLTGNYRGEVHGNAQVEWIRTENRYQVHLDVSVGPSFAPLFSRRMTSEGLLTAEGLSPQRYDEESKALFRSPRRRTMHFEPDTVVLANGERTDSLPGVQDTASQFVQLTYLFSIRPDLLTAGNTVDVPLALPRHVSRWHYDVLAPETLATPFGDISSIQLKPRREARKADDLVFDVWVSPELAYLPVRIRITQDDDTYIDLLISKRPDVALP